MHETKVQKKKKLLQIGFSFSFYVPFCMHFLHLPPLFFIPPPSLTSSIKSDATQFICMKIQSLQVVLKISHEISIEDTILC